jgi:lipopolysaccharide/colanic/teichoic acid biosynthesis glycosyltransferase
MTTETNFRAKSVASSKTIERDGSVPNSPLSRVFDVVFILLALPYILLFFLIISILIAMDSKGGVIYKQIRIGKGGVPFKAYKFRTMVLNADQALQKHLDKSPELKAEWLANHKLKRDPRITRVGAILRKISLDEMPQFWNILIGDMSLIGPRPIVEAEIERYGKCFELYKQARPGLTGLWQVSGRSDTSYKRRVELDEYYLLNRTIKLDIQILFKTVYVVIGRKGAY